MKHTKTKIFLSCIALIIAPVAISLFSGDTSAVDYCVSDKCKAAQAAEKEAKDKAEASTTAANTLEGEVERLNNEIAIIESRIATNQATADDLAKSIQLNEEKLAAEQEALAEMLVDIYFDGEPDALTLLASSSSISEYAAKQAQMDTVKTQINLSAESVKLLKEELEQQKLEVERIIADQETQQSTDDGGRAGKSRHENSLRSIHAAADQRNGNRHSLRNVVQTDQHRQNKGGAAHNAVMIGVRRADGHAFRNIVQGNGAGHDHASNHQREFIILSGIVHLIVIAVDQLIQIICRFGMVRVNMRNLRIGLPVNQKVQEKGEQHANRNGHDHGQDPHLRCDCFGHQIKTHYAQHDAAGEAQQKTDRAV